MTQIERIKAEIESRIEEHQSEKANGSVDADVRIDECESILNYIYFIEKELLNSDIEEEIKRYFAQKEYDTTNYNEIARHFANWQNERIASKVIAEQDCTCIKPMHRLIGGTWNLVCPTDKLGLNNGDKVKLKIIKV